MEQIKVLNEYYINLDYDKIDKEKIWKKVLKQATDDNHTYSCLVTQLLTTVDKIKRPYNSEMILTMFRMLSGKIDGRTSEGKMIILEDSDLYAVISCLIITADHNLYKIWVQERVKEKFLWLMKRYYSDLHTLIDTFQSWKDIEFHADNIGDVKAISIWSEDIVVAKNLALSLRNHLVFINTYMDVCGDNVHLCYQDAKHYLQFSKIMNLILENMYPDIEESVNAVRLSRIEYNAATTCNLFYDGTWQKPIKGMYWKHNDTVCANATNDDISKCYRAAWQGWINTWSITTITTRKHILSKLVSTLKDAGKVGLAAIVERCLWGSYLYKNTAHHNSNMEIIRTRKPLGIIILREKNENVLFFRLMQILIAGNAVIVMFSPNFYNLAPYCDMFSTCGIPPGVINLLSHEDTSKLEERLCSVTYIEYANQFFLKGNSLETYVSQYEKLTLPKNVILHLM